MLICQKHTEKYSAPPHNTNGKNPTPQNKQENNLTMFQWTQAETDTGFE